MDMTATINNHLAYRSLQGPMAKLRKMLKTARYRTSCPDANRDFGKIEESLNQIDRLSECADWLGIIAAIADVYDVMADLSDEIKYMTNIDKKDSARRLHARAIGVIGVVRKVAFCETLRV